MRSSTYAWCCSGGVCFVLRRPASSRRLSIATRPTAYSFIASLPLITPLKQENLRSVLSFAKKIENIFVGFVRYHVVSCQESLSIYVFICLLVAGVASFDGVPMPCGIGDGLLLCDDGILRAEARGRKQG